MTTKSKPIWQQVDDLGIERNILYEIGGGLDHLETLFFVLAEYLEGIEESLKNTQINLITIGRTKRVINLLNIACNERENINNFLDKLIEQMGRDK